jgi:outer membrane PBP1 activator LpoA protein
MTYLRQLTTAELGKAHHAADYLHSLPAHLDPDLAIKLDTLRADLTAEIEDRQHADRQARHKATTRASQHQPTTPPSRAAP